MRAARAAVLALALGAAGCSGGDAPAEPAAPAGTAPAFEVRDVVAAAVAALERELGPAPPPPPDAAPEQAERVRGLARFLAEARGDLRAAALEDVRAEGDAAVAVLDALARDGAAPAEERAAAVEMLAALASEAATDALVALLEGAEEGWLRAHAAWRLGNVPHDRVVLPLVARLKYETFHDAVVWIADALARHGNLAGLDGLLVVAATSPDSAERAAAAAKLAELAGLHGAADGAELERRWRAGDVAPPERSRRFELEVWRTVARLAEWQLRGVDDARFVLERLDAPAAEVLGRALHDDDVYVRAHAAQCLARMGPRARPACPELVRALAAPELAPLAAEALGRVGCPEAARELGARLGASTPLELRIAAARGLARLADAPAAAALRPLADDAAAPLEVRQAAVEGLLRADAAAASDVRLAAELLEDPRVEPATTAAALGLWIERHAEPEQRARWAELRAADRHADLAALARALVETEPGSRF